MINFSTSASSSKSGYVTETASSENSVTTASATQQRVNTAAQQTSSKAIQKVSKTTEHPLLKKIQRFHGGSDISDVRQGKLFHVVSALRDKLEKPMSAQELNDIVPNATVFKDPQRSSGFFDIYTSPGFRIPDSYGVRELEARVSIRDGGVNVVILSLDAASLRPQTLEKQYGKLRCQLPRGESPQEMISYICKQPWGELRFGYRQSSPELLDSIVFDKRTEPLALG